MLETLHIRLPDSAVTDALGVALAHALPLDPGVSVLYLHGELGTGKTTCVRSLLRALGVAGAIRSPTYTLVELYAVPGRTCIHVDLYRLQADEVDELGLRDHLGSEALLLVEWPERGAGMLPPADVELALAYAGDAREALAVARSERGLHWLQNLLHDRSLATYVVNLT